MPPICGYELTEVDDSPAQSRSHCDRYRQTHEQGNKAHIWRSHNEQIEVGDDWW